MQGKLKLERKTHPDHARMSLIVWVLLAEQRQANDKGLEQENFSEKFLTEILDSKSTHILTLTTPCKAVFIKTLDWLFFET